MHAATSGKDAVGEGFGDVDFDGTVVSGKGASIDLIETGARPHLSALNRLARFAGQRTREVGP